MIPLPHRGHVKINNLHYAVKYLNISIIDTPLKTCDLQSEAFFLRKNTEVGEIANARSCIACSFTVRFVDKLDLYLLYSWIEARWRRVARLGPDLREICGNFNKMIFASQVIADRSRATRFYFQSLSYRVFMGVRSGVFARRFPIGPWLFRQWRV